MKTESDVEEEEEKVKPSKKTVEGIFDLVVADIERAEPPIFIKTDQRQSNKLPETSSILSDSVASENKKKQRVSKAER